MLGLSGRLQAQDAVLCLSSGRMETETKQVDTGTGTKFHNPSCSLVQQWCLSQIHKIMYAHFKDGCCNYQWFCMVRSPGSTVGIATGYGLDDESELDSWQGQEISHPHIVYTSSGAHPAFYLIGTMALFSSIKRPGVKLTTHLHLVPR
jgi:hypothetical protein